MLVLSSIGHTKSVPQYAKNIAFSKYSYVSYKIENKMGKTNVNASYKFHRELNSTAMWNFRRWLTFYISTGKGCSTVITMITKFGITQSDAYRLIEIDRNEYVEMILFLKNNDYTYTCFKYDVIDIVFIYGLSDAKKSKSIPIFVINMTS